MTAASVKLLILTILAGMAKSLLITEAAELALVSLIGVKDRKRFRLVFLANIITNPPAVLIYTLTGLLIGSRAAAIAAIPIEIAVLLAEWRIYYRKSVGLRYVRDEEISALVLSLVLNIASYGLGALISGR